MTSRFEYFDGRRPRSVFDGLSPRNKWRRAYWSARHDQRVLEAPYGISPPGAAMHYILQELEENAQLPGLAVALAIALEHRFMRAAGIA